MFMALIKQIPTLREPETCQDVLQLRKFPEKATDTPGGTRPLPLPVSRDLGDSVACGPRFVLHPHIASSAVYLSRTRTLTITFRVTWRPLRILISRSLITSSNEGTVVSSGG